MMNIARSWRFTAFFVAVMAGFCLGKTENASAADNDAVQLGSGELTGGIPGKGPLTIKQIRAWLNREDVHQPLTVKLPLGMSVAPVPTELFADNPLTRAKIELGRQLYFDKRLSVDNTVSCASCHDPKTGYAAPTQFGVGIEKLTGNRNSPTAYNRILSAAQFWDGRAGSLEEQAVGPIANPIEMGNTHDQAVKTIAAIPGYKLQFERIFGPNSVNIDNVGRAIAAFERVLVTGPSPFDYYEKAKPFMKFEPEDLEDDPDLAREYKAVMDQLKANPMSESAIRGRDLFFSEKVNCAACHVGANLTDEKYHNLGVGMDQEKPDLGRYEVTKEEKDKGAFKTPTIRNVAQTAPYMHDGSQKTLMEVVEHYAKGGVPNPYLSEKIVKLELSDQDKKDLVAFMEACTGPLPEVETGRLP